MGRLLRDELLEEFKKEFNINSNNSVIFIGLDNDKKIAYYVLEENKKIKEDYEKILKYYNK